MKVGYIVALLMIILIAGCATQKESAPAAPPAAPAAPETPPAVPEAPAAPETPAEETPAVVEGDIVVTSAGFDPVEMEVVVGTTLAIKSAEGRHKLTVDGKTTQIIEEGAAADVTFDKVGKIRVFDIFTKKSAYITVTEEAAEEIEETEE